MLTLLGGSGIALLLAKAHEFKQQELKNVSAEAMHEVREKALTKIYGDADMGKSLADSPEILFVLLNLTIWLTPMLVALMGFDGISSDLQHKSVRYWTLRTRRVSYFVGKWLGLLCTVSIITFSMDAMIWIVTLARGGSDVTAAQVFVWGLKFWVITLPMSAVWCGIAMLVSSLFKNPIIALLLTFASFFMLWLMWISGTFFNSVEWLTYVYPNHYDHFMLHPRAPKAFTGLGVCLAMAAMYVSIGSYSFVKRDV